MTQNPLRLLQRFSIASLLVFGAACSSDDTAANQAPATGSPVGPGEGMPGPQMMGAEPGQPAPSEQPAGTAPAAQPTTPAAGTGAQPQTPAMPTGVPVQEEEVVFVSDAPPDSTPAGGFVPTEKVDLLFVVDNSSSMADKQQIFKAVVPDLIDQMANPPCVVADTKEFQAYPEGGTGCPAGSSRIFDPVTDIHIGLISSSLGPHTLEGEDLPAGCSNVPEENDRAWLLGRVRAELNAESYQGWGFLNWDQKQVSDPPGDADLATIINKFETQVDAVGEFGCGFEAPLEAAYRFLIEPDPYESLERVPCAAGSSAECVQPVGVDADLLAQRSAFLRPDSVVVVVYLTDENDCSFRAQGQGYLTMQTLTQLKSGTAACDADPNDACCSACGAEPAGCDTDPATNGCNRTEDDIEAKPLRCFDQKRRFGIDLLRSTDVYVGGFINSLVADRDKMPQQNPLFTSTRGREKIFVVGIIGVPWQDTATAETIDAVEQGRFDLIEASQVDWAQFLPTNGAPPTDPFNIETNGARAGSHPLTGDAVGGPGTWNAVNGHDRELSTEDILDDDLQFSCIFPLSEPRDCSGETELLSCDCVAATDGEGTERNYYEGNPLCYDATTQTYGTTQYYAKAYPGPRMLEVLKGVSCPDEGADCTDQSVLASICPRQITDPSKQDFGFRPVIRALLLNVAKRIVR